MSELVLGTAQWARPYGVANRSGPPELAELRRMLDLAWERGVRTIDTARAYGSEERIGELLAETRREWRVVTKLAHDVLDGAPDAAEIARRVRASVEASRAALRVARLETLLLHRAAHRTSAPLRDALRGLRESGAVGALGASVESPELAAGCLDDAELRALQVAASAADRRLEKSGFFERAASRGVALFVRSVFLQGALLMDEASLAARLPGLAAARHGLHDAAARLGRAPRQALLAYARDRFRAAVVVGAESAAQLGQLLDDWASPPLDPGALAALASAAPDTADAWLDPSRWPR